MSADVAATDGLIRAALDRPVRAAVSCSMQAGGVALLHMLRRYEPDIPVLFVDTGYHFPETLAFRDRLAAEWRLNLWNLTAPVSVTEQEAELGSLNRTDPDRCCDLRKVAPLYAALERFDVWFTALRRDQAETRAGTRSVERKLLPTGKVIEKVNPLTAWSWEDVMTYSTVHDVPVHPLHDAGYPSIGCAPCTSPSVAADPRSGRWAGVRLECGLHTRAEDVA